MWETIKTFEEDNYFSNNFFILEITSTILLYLVNL